MIWIEHRRNKIADLKDVDPKNGVEIDLRALPSLQGQIHISHEPWEIGPSLTEWLKEFAQRKIQGPIILNTKEDGLEDVIVAALKDLQLRNYFFLDTTIPTLVKRSHTVRLTDVALRFSKFEKIESVLEFKGKCHWVWADCFFGEGPSVADLKRLREYFKVCLVSPELQGLDRSKIVEFASVYGEQVDAVCTKSVATWKVELNR